MVADVTLRRRWGDGGALGADGEAQVRATARARELLAQPPRNTTHEGWRSVACVAGSP